MGTLNEKEVKLLSEIVESIEEELFSVTQGFANNDRLAYLTCLTDNEKVEYTKQEIKKLQDSFKVCNPDISEYIFALIQKHPSDNSTQEENQKQIIEIFILGEYSETFDLLMKTGKGNTFKELLVDLDHEPKLIDEFIGNVANANRYLELVELLNDVSPSISEPKSLQTGETISEYLFSMPENGKSELDMVNYIERVTDGYKIDKLLILLKDVDFTIFQLEEENLPDEVEITSKLKKYISEGKEIPYMPISPILLRYGTEADIAKASEIIDLDKLFPLRNIELFPLYQFKNHVESKINQQESTAPQPNENPHPEIFAGPKGFKIFTCFKEQIPFIESPNSEYADYSFLFNSLKKDKFIHDVKHKTFIEFLDKQYKVEFAKIYNQFKVSSTRQKKDAYATCKLQFH